MNLLLATVGTQTASAADTLSKAFGGIIAFGIGFSLFMWGCMIAGGVLGGLALYRAMEKKNNLVMLLSGIAIGLAVIALFKLRLIFAPASLVFGIIAKNKSKEIENAATGGETIRTDIE